MTRRLLSALLLLSLGCAQDPVRTQERRHKLSPLPKAPRLNEAEVKLGKMLFHDVRLSGDVTVSCAICHLPNKAFTDRIQLSAGYTSGLHFRNTPTVVNSAFKKYFYWDGRFAGSDLASVVRDSISDAHFMLADGRLVVERLRQVPEYVKEFTWIYGEDPSYANILRAVSAYCSSLTSKDAPLDRYLGGDENALSASAKKGMNLFTGKAGCVSCHHGPMLTDWKFRDRKVPNNPKIFDDVLRHIGFRRYFKVMGVEGYPTLREDLGRYAVTKNPEDKNKFLTPSLREVARTAPYMHNGMLPTLDAVIKHENPSLSSSERKALIAFLESLSGTFDTQAPPPRPAYGVRDLGRQ